MKIAMIAATSLALASLTTAVSANQTGRDVDDAETMQNTQSMDHMEDQPSNLQTDDERHNVREVIRESEKVLQNMKRAGAGQGRVSGAGLRTRCLRVRRSRAIA